jgi:gag-polypeptide of LTR copia-type
MSASKAETSIRVVMFDGKQISWVSWEEKFLARASMMGYRDLLSGEKSSVVPKKSDVDDADPDDDEGKEVLANKRLNISVYSDLVLSMDSSTAYGRVAFNIVRATRTQEYPDGNAHMAWVNLKKKYTPTTTYALSTLHKKYNMAVLKKGYDPDVFMTYLHDIRIQMADMGHTITDDQFMLHILSNLNGDYEMVQYMLDRRIAYSIYR